MNSIEEIRNHSIAAEVLKNADVKIRLEQWPCAVALLGVSAAWAFVNWVNSQAES